MTDAGDIWLADLNDERRRRVLVISTGRFNGLADRAIVVPEMKLRPGAVLEPWRFETDDAVFAVDRIQNIKLERLLEKTGSVPYPVMRQIRHALLQIT